MKCMRCGKEMRNTIGGCYTCDECGFGINDLVYRGGATKTTAEWTDKDSLIFNPVTPTTTTDGLATSPTQGTVTLPYNTNQGFVSQGWKCPKCGAILSPSTSFCLFCSPTITPTVTCGTNDCVNTNFTKLTSENIHLFTTTKIKKLKFEDGHFEFYADYEDKGEQK